MEQVLETLDNAAAYPDATPHKHQKQANPGVAAISAACNYSRTLNPVHMRTAFFFNVVVDGSARLPSVSSDASGLAGIVVAVVGVVVGVIAITVAVRSGRAHRRDIEQARGDIQKARSDIQKARKHIRRLRRKTLSALGLHEVLVNDPELEQGVRRIATQYYRISVEDNSDPLLLELAHRKLYDTAHFMNMASESHITWGNDSFTLAETLASTLLALTERGDHFWASSLVDPSFWRRATAYLKQQEEKSAAGVTICRVFIFNDKQPYDDKCKAQMKMQQDAGIHVTHIDETNLAGKDLVVVCRPDEKGNLVPLYAMECRVDRSTGHIENIELWVAQGLQATTVEKAWWSLHGTFALAPNVEPPLESVVTPPLESPPEPDYTSA